MSAHDATRPVRLPRRSGQGIVMGLDGWQVATLATAGAVLWIFVNRFGPAGLLYSAPLYLGLGVAAVTSIHGVTTPRMVALWTMKRVRQAAGATTQTYRPERPRLAGTLNLPGVRASVQLWETEGIAAVYSPTDRTVSVTAELEVQGFLMQDLPARWDLSQQWERVLASFTQRPGIKRIALQERTLPSTIRAARDHWETIATGQGADSESPVTANYREVMDGSERFAVAHRNYLTFTLDLVALGAQLKSLGGGKDAILALASLEAANLGDALQAAKITVRSWLTARDIAALARTAFDPEFAATIQNRDDATAGVDPIAIGPMHLDEPAGRNGIVITDSGVHTTMWVHEWPRSDAPVGFLSPVVFARHPVTGEAVTHIFTLVLTPVSVGKALKRIRDEKKVWRGNEQLRAKRGADGSAAYLTITAPNEEHLDQTVAGMRNALSRAGMEAQTLYCQQAEALMVNALPIGLGMK
jgi:hypothetical protein